MKWLITLFTGSSPSLLIAVAVVLAGTAAWGGIGWYGKASAERALADYQLAAARVLADQLAENQRLSEQQARRSADIADAFEKGKRQHAQDIAPALQDLAFLRARFACHEPGGLCNDAAPGPGAVPGAPGPTREPDATACTDRPRAIVEATAGIAQDLAACADTTAQLTSLQAWVRDVCGARHQ